MSKRIIAIDPGEMTGWAIGVITEDPMTGQKILEVEQYGYDPWKPFCMNYMSVMDGENPFDTVVYESFRIRAESAKALIGSDNPTSQCIGIIKYGAWKHGAKLVTSEPSNKPIIDRQMGGADRYLPKRDSVEHYRDACRHIHWYAINKEGIHPDDTRRV